MLFLLDCLKCHGVVREWVLNVPEICLIADDFLAPGLVEEPSSQLAALLIISYLIKIVAARLTVIVSTLALGHVGEALVDEATYFKSR